MAERGLVGIAVLAGLVLLGCGSRERDGEQAQAALRTKLERDTKAVWALEEEMVADMAGVHEFADDERERATAEGNELWMPPTPAEREAAIAKARAEFAEQVTTAHTRLLGAVDEDFFAYCTALSNEDARCLRDYGEALARRHAAFDRCEDGEAGNACVAKAREAWADANPDCAILDHHIDDFFARVD